MGMEVVGSRSLFPSFSGMWAFWDLAWSCSVTGVLLLCPLGIPRKIHKVCLVVSVSLPFWSSQNRQPMACKAPLTEERRGHHTRSWAGVPCGCCARVHVPSASLGQHASRSLSSLAASETLQMLRRWEVTGWAWPFEVCRAGICEAGCSLPWWSYFAHLNPLTPAFLWRVWHLGGWLWLTEATSLSSLSKNRYLRGSMGLPRAETRHRRLCVGFSQHHLLALIPVWYTRARSTTPLGPLGTARGSPHVGVTVGSLTQMSVRLEGAWWHFTKIQSRQRCKWFQFALETVPG